MPARIKARHWVLAGLTVVLVLVLFYQFGRSGNVPAGSRSSVRTVPSRDAAARDRAESVPALRLAALKAPRVEPPATTRNLFREQPKAPPPPPARPAPPPTPPPDPNAAPPPPPPITLQLVAIVQGSGKPLAALTDGRDVFYGREGEIVEGRYRIVKVNVESVDISYADGRGQRRIALTGR